MARRPRARSPLRGCLRFLLAGLLLVVLAVAGQVRDRSRGYSVDLLLEPPAGTAPRLRVGLARRDINPDLPDTWTDADCNGKYEPDKGDTFQDGNGNGRLDAIYIAGFSNNRPAAGVGEEIAAIALVIDDGTHRVGIVALDAIGFMHDDVVNVRRRLEGAWAIDHLIVCSTHSHECPDLLGIWGRVPFRSGVNQAYRRRVIDRAAEAVGAAVSALQPATMRLHQVPDLREGLVRDTRRPEVHDADLRLVRFVDGAGGTIGTILGWANHPEAMWDDNLMVSPDYVGAFRRGVEDGLILDGEVVEPGVGGTAIFLNGAIGGLLTPARGMVIRDPLTNQDIEEPSAAKAEALGRQLAKAALRVMREDPIPAPTQPALRLRAKTLTLALDNPLYRAAAILGVIDRGFTGWLRVRSEVNVLQLGDVWFLAVPGEVYPEIVNGGIENPPGADYRTSPVEVPPWRQRMRGKLNFVIGLANDEIGYIIPRSEWDTAGPEHLYGEDDAPYGEINSLGVKTAPDLHQATMGLFDEFAAPAGGSPPTERR